MGLWIGLNKVVFYRLGGLGVFSIFNAISPEGELGSDFWNTIIAYSLAAAIGFAIQMAMPVPALEKNTDAVKTDASVK